MGQTDGASSGRNTRQKSLILSCLKVLDQEHITADGLVELLKSRKTPVAKSTVYRFLSQLEESGLVRRYILSDSQSACYQFVGGDKPCMRHYHMMCLECGGIVHFESGALSDALSHVSEAEGFVIDGGKTVFYGLCSSCARDGDCRI